MTTLIVFKWVYLTLAVTGLAVNVVELHNALGVYQTLVNARINGARQAIASHFVRKALMLCGIQFFLSFAAVISLCFSSPVIRNYPDWPYAEDLAMVAVLSHMAAVLMLTLMAIMSWYDRSFSMNMLGAEITKARVIDKIEKADVAGVLKQQLDTILAAVMALKDRP